MCTWLIRCSVVVWCGTSSCPKAWAATLQSFVPFQMTQVRRVLVLNPSWKASFWKLKHVKDQQRSLYSMCSNLKEAFSFLLNWWNCWSYSFLKISWNWRSWLLNCWNFAPGGTLCAGIKLMEACEASGTAGRGSSLLGNLQLRCPVIPMDLERWNENRHRHENIENREQEALDTRVKWAVGRNAGVLWDLARNSQTSRSSHARVYLWSNNVCSSHSYQKSYFESPRAASFVHSSASIFTQRIWLDLNASSIPRRSLAFLDWLMHS